MAGNINRVIITGNLTRDPEVRSLPSGTSVCELRVACNGRRYGGPFIAAREASLGDDCVVEAGLYVTAGTKVTAKDGESTKTIKALELAGASNVLFRRNSLTGGVEAVPWKGTGIELNAALHSND